MTGKGLIDSAVESAKAMRKARERKLTNNFQCRECYSVLIECYKDQFGIKPDRFECQNCGCTWHKER